MLTRPARVGVDWAGWFSDQSLGRQLEAAFALVLLVLQAASGFALWATLTDEQADDRVTHGYDLLDLSETALNAADDMESSYQAFLITGDPLHLERYAAGQRNYYSQLNQLQTETVSPSMLARWTELQARGGALQRDVLEPAIAARQSPDSNTITTPSAASLVSIGAGIQGFAGLRLVLDEAIDIQRAALDVRIDQSAESSKRMLAVLIGGTVFVTGLAAVAFNRMADHLQTTIDQTESILHSAGEGIMGSNTEHGLTFVNPTAAAMLGYAPAELVGRPVHATVHHSRVDGTVYPSESCPVHLTLADGLTRSVTDEVMWRKDGTSFPVEYTCGRLRTPGAGRGGGAVVTFRDVSGRKRLEEDQRRGVLELRRQSAELVRSNRELQDFASIASHDLQEPLRKVQAFGDRLQRKYHDQLDDDGRMYLDRMQNAAGRMQTLIGDLLVLSRVTTQVRPFAVVDLNVLVRDVIADLEVAIEKSGAQLEVCPLPTVTADAVQMRQLFQNLLSNGLKFQQAGVAPRLRIASRSIEGHSGSTGEAWWEISVTDNGIGFDEKYLDRIFTIFQRLHGRDEYEGTGVGLAVCRKIVDRHGGSITARSTPQQGSTFLITLPSTHDGAESVHAV